MSAAQGRQPEGIPAGGQFTGHGHGEAPVSLAARPVDPEQVVSRVLDAICAPHSDSWHYGIAKKHAMQDGEATAAEVFEEMSEQNHNGRCRSHQNSLRILILSCVACRVAMAMEHAVNPGPEPVPIGPAPRPTMGSPVKKKELVSEEWDEVARSNTKTRVLTGDEAFEAALRNMLGAPAGAKVTVTDVTAEYGDYTKEYVTEITVKAGDKTATFEGMGALMRRLDEKDPDGPLEMAQRLVQASGARRPLLKGPAAIYLRQNLYNGAKPEFAEVMGVYGTGRDPRIHVLYQDGRDGFIYVNTIAAITETDQTEIYEEKP